MRELSDLEFGDIAHEEITRPDTPQATRNTTAKGLVFTEMCATIMGELEARRTVTARSLCERMRRIWLEFASWEKCHPTEDVRSRKIHEFWRLAAQARALLDGER